MNASKGLRMTAVIVLKNILSFMLFYLAVVAVGYFAYKLVTKNYNGTAEVIYLVLSVYLCIRYILKNFPKRKELQFVWDWFCMEITILFCEHSYRIESDLNYHMIEPRFHDGKEIVHYGDYCHEVTLKCSKCRKRKKIPGFFTSKEELL